MAAILMIAFSTCSGPLSSSTPSTPQAPAPVFTNGNFQSYPGGTASVSITCSNSSATIYYTTDGSTPSPGNSDTLKYTGPISVSFSGTMYIKAIAVVAGMTNSTVVTATLTTTSVVQPTVPSATTILYSTTLPSFTISSQTGSASIAFTIDGTTPVITGATLESGTPTLSGSGTYMMSNNNGSGCTFYYGGTHSGGSFTLTAVAFITAGSGNISSSSATATYTFQLTAPTWAGVQPQSTYFTTAQSVTLSCASGSIYYSTVASPAVTPANGTLYSSAITVPVGAAGSSTSETIQAIAHETNWQDSVILSGVFNICGPGVWNQSNWNQATWQ